MFMETAQERETHAWRWPLDTMACSFGDTGCFLFEWVPQLRYFVLGVVGVGAAGDPPHDHTHTPHGHELELFFPKCMESPASEAAAAVTVLPANQDTMVMYDEFDELLQNFRDGNEEQQLVGFDSSSFLKEEENSDVTCFLEYDGDDLPLALSSVSPMQPLDNILGQPQAEQEQPPSSASSHCNVGPYGADTGTSADKNCSSKRPVTSEGAERASSKRSRTAAAPPSGAGTSVVYPFAVVKPSGLDGGATLADINARILTRPARPVRHPVGEFACSPRGAAGGNRPAPSGKRVVGFTRLQTAGNGTITIIRTKG